MSFSTPEHTRTMRRRWFLGATLASSSMLAGCGVFKDDEKPHLVGRRVDVLSTGAGLTVDPDDHTPISLPAAMPVSDWPQFGRHPSHLTSDTPWNGPHRLWRHSIGAGISEPGWLAFAALGSNGRGAIQSPPVIAEGKIYTRDAQGVVRAWTWPEMKSLWVFNPKPKKVRSTDIGGGVAVDGDTVYIVDGIAQTIAVDAATGKPKWRVEIGTPGRSAPTVAEGKVYFGTIDERLFALDAKTGNQIWTYQAATVDTVIFGQPAPAVVDGVVLAGFGSGDLVALRAASGEVVWSDNLGGSNGRGAMLDLSCIRGAPVISSGTAYAISMSSVLVAIDMRSGRRLWEREVAGMNMPVVCGDWLYIIDMDQQLACLDRLSGHVRWIKPLRRFGRIRKQKDAITWLGPVLAGGKLVAVSTYTDTGMQIVDAIHGQPHEKDDVVIKTTSPTMVPPIICDGKVLVLSSDGNLTAYG